MVVGDNPVASSPSKTGKAAWKSPVDTPRRYTIGRTSVTLGARRMSLGRIGRVKRCRWPSASTRRSSMRGARTSKVPLPVTRCRAGAVPLRTTCARPRSSRASRCRRMYSSTSASSASCSIFSAPRCRSSSSVVRSSSFSLVGFSTTLSMGGVSLARLLTGPVYLELTRRIRRLLSFSRSTTFGYISDPFANLLKSLGEDDRSRLTPLGWGRGCRFCTRVLTIVNEEKAQHGPRSSSSFHQLLKHRVHSLHEFSLIAHLRFEHLNVGRALSHLLLQLHLGDSLSLHVICKGVDVPSNAENQDGHQGSQHRCLPVVLHAHGNIPRI